MKKTGPFLAGQDDDFCVTWHPKAADVFIGKTYCCLPERRGLQQKPSQPEPAKGNHQKLELIKETYKLGNIPVYRYKGAIF